jgi:hypothetical protein
MTQHYAEWTQEDQLVISGLEHIFLGNKEEGYGRRGRPLINIDLSGLKMATPNKSAKELHYGLMDFNRAIMKNDKLQFDEPRFDGSRILHTIWLSLLGNSVSEGK